MNYKQLYWLPGYLKKVHSPQSSVHGLRHLIFCLVDHFEPFGYRQAYEKNITRLQKWISEYPSAVKDLIDADGKTMRHSMFCAAEDYTHDYMSIIENFCAQGYGEVEIHLHHRNDTPEGLREKLLRFRDQLHNNHNLLGTDKAGNPRYAFIHGNWALCNSRPDGDWCGVNKELTVLKETGCYADFTFPSAPDITQPRTVNMIYRATDNPNGHGADTGAPIIFNSLQLNGQQSDGLMIVTGPLALNWHSRKYGILPGIENSDISASRPPTPQRADLWVKQNIHIKDKPDWTFVKVHTHGMVPANSRILFGQEMRTLHEYMQNKYNDEKKWALHYVTAREMYNIIRAAEDGMTGMPDEYRDYEIKV